VRRYLLLELFSPVGGVRLDPVASGFVETDGVAAAAAHLVAVLEDLGALGSTRLSEKLVTSGRGCGFVPHVFLGRRWGDIRNAD
jgi:hypothetical protein